jgi:ribose 1,5-bisphosphokinase PhnN
LAELPWIGPVTMHHLAKNLGTDTAKPDVHLERLARRDRTTTHKLCQRLARETGYRIATIDSVLWRACADGVLSSQAYELHGWRMAFRGSAQKAAPTTD